MSIFFVLLGIVGVLMLVILLLIAKIRGDFARHALEINYEKSRAAAATTQITDRQHLDEKLTTLHETHRHETQIAQQHVAERNDFDNDWADGLRGTVTTDSDNTSSAADYQPADIATYTGARADLSDG